MSDPAVIDPKDINFYKSELEKCSIHYDKVKRELDKERSYSNSLLSLLDEDAPKIIDHRSTFAALAIHGAASSALDADYLAEQAVLIADALIMKLNEPTTEPVE